MNPFLRLLHRKRWILLSLIVLVPIGFTSKFYDGPGHNWVNNSLGGVFYEIFWCLVLAFLFDRLKSGRIALSVLGATCILEFLQLWHLPFLESLRNNFIGVTILGNAFTWSDFPYYFIGSILGYVILVRLRAAEYVATA